MLDRELACPIRQVAGGHHVRRKVAQLAGAVRRLGGGQGGVRRRFDLRASLLCHQGEPFQLGGLAVVGGPRRLEAIEAVRGEDRPLDQGRGKVRVASGGKRPGDRAGSVAAPLALGQGGGDAPPLGVDVLAAPHSHDEQALGTTRPQHGRLLERRPDVGGPRCALQPVWKPIVVERAHRGEIGVELGRRLGHDLDSHGRCSTIRRPGGLLEAPDPRPHRDHQGAKPRCPRP